jgi:hypothetical protein
LTRNSFQPILFICLLIAAIMSSCSNSAGPTTTPTASQTAVNEALVTPYAEQPAAGICASYYSTVVVIALEPDIAAPRCAKVRPDQTLRIVNNTENNLQVSFAGILDTQLSPGARTSIDTPFGDYLAPGVHQVKVSPCCGAEIWLVEK